MAASSAAGWLTSRTMHNEICSKLVPFQEIKWKYINQEHRKLHVPFVIEVFINVQSGTGKWLSKKFCKIISRSELKVASVTCVLVQKREMFKL